LTPSPASESSGRRRNAPRVALALLEVIRAQDRPTEILADEDPTVTMPRRLGLSEVVETQIRRYRADVKEKRKLSDQELQDLFRLVIRRPDSEEVFLLSGARLAEGVVRSQTPRGKVRLRVAFFKARRAFRAKLKALFGRKMGGFGSGPFLFEGAGLLFVQADPGGDACRMVTGMCEGILKRYVGSSVDVRHTLCQSRGDSTCRWVGITREGLESDLEKQDSGKERGDSDGE
jgi:hypothetical protein